MAVLITSESIVKLVNPKGVRFDIAELNDIVEGWIEPFKIGPLWIMHSEDSKKYDQNEIASTIFQISLRGKVLVVPVQQLPKEWDLMNPEDEKYTGEEVDMGFLLSLHKTLVNRNLASENAIYSPDGSMFFNDRRTKEIWTYDPREDEDIEEETARNFLKEKVYPFLVRSKKKQLKDMLLFEDDEIIVKVSTIDDFLYTINRIIQVYVEEEEYEKCAQLQKIAEQIRVESL
jgi:hypothetical protein